MKYVDRYKIENAVAIRKAKIRFKVLSALITITMLIGIVLFMISVSAMDFDPIRAFGAMAVSMLLLLLAIGVCKALDIDIFEESDED